MIAWLAVVPVVFGWVLVMERLERRLLSGRAEVRPPPTRSSSSGAQVRQVGHTADHARRYGCACDRYALWGPMMAVKQSWP